MYVRKVQSIDLPLSPLAHNPDFETAFENNVGKGEKCVVFYYIHLNKYYYYYFFLIYCTCDFLRALFDICENLMNIARLIHFVTYLNE